MDPFWIDEEFDYSTCDVCGLRFCEGHTSFLQRHSKNLILITSFCLGTLMAGLAGFWVGDSGQSSTVVVTSTTMSLSSQNERTSSTTTSTVPTSSSVVVVVLTSDEELMLNLVNQERNSQGLQELSWCPPLARSAKAHSIDMATRDFYNHDTPEGVEISDRAEAQGYEYSYVGENIAVGQKSVNDVMIAWMNSKGHRENILEENYSHFGYGKAKGNLDGEPGYIYWTQNFGSGGDCA